MWEYFTDSIDLGVMFQTGYVDPKALTDRLNWYGGQGWELVSTLHTQTGGGLTRQVVLIFKRPRVQPAPSAPPQA